MVDRVSLLPGKDVDKNFLSSSIKREYTITANILKSIYRLRIGVMLGCGV